MAQQPLNCTNVRTGFEQMRGKSVPQAVGGDPLGEAGSDDDRVQDTLDRARRDVAAQDGAWEEKGALGTYRFPVRPKRDEQAPAQHHIAVLRALAPANVDEHALTVDVRGMQRAGLGDAQPGAVRGHQDRAVFDGVDLPEQMLDFPAGQDVGQRLGPLRPWNAGDYLRPAERRGVEELDRRDIHVMGRRADLPFLHEMRQECVDLRRASSVGGRR